VVRALAGDRESSLSWAPYSVISLALRDRAVIAQSSRKLFAGARAAAATCLIPASRERYARLGGAGLCNSRSRTDEGVLLAKQISRDACIAIQATPRPNRIRRLHMSIDVGRSRKDLPHKWARLVFVCFLVLPATAGYCQKNISCHN
jgi:hypothetical protein